MLHTVALHRVDFLPDLGFVTFCHAPVPPTPFDFCSLLSTHVFFHDRKDDVPLRRLYGSGSIQRSLPFNAG